jgi:hypothetical protein
VEKAAMNAIQIEGYGNPTKAVKVVDLPAGRANPININWPPQRLRHWRGCQ